jgi:hypothetical protein
MRLELTGLRFSRLLVVRPVKIEGANNAMWECLCDCGEITFAAASNIKSGTTRSCGCLVRDTSRKTLTGNTRNRTHNMSRSSEHKTWCTMKQRCGNPKNHKYKDYGARGITVCERWIASFENFYADMGPKPSKAHSIDREDNDGPYHPDNCRWSIPLVQARNSRRARVIEIDGQKRCISEWVEFLGVPAWKPKEMIRGRGRNRDQPPEYPSIEAALTALYFTSVAASR